MNLNTTQKAATLAVSLALAAGMAGCRVHVDKDTNGQEKKVQVDTPFGGVHVNTNQTTATDLGLPAYPGAVVVKDDDDHNSADVHLGFGEWELRVRTVSYETPDSEEKVTAFYTQAMGRYGNVITCRGDSPVGTPAVTSEGLGCADDKQGGHVKIGRNENGKDSVELKAGSRRHQHILGFEGSKDKQTRFALVALDLPAAVESGSGKSD